MSSKIVLTSFATLMLLILTTVPVTVLATEPGSRDIPITSTSSEAISLFKNGREAFEMGHINEATSLFDRALMKDNQLALAWLYKFYMSNSDEEMRVNLEKAIRNIRTVSEGERILIKIAEANLMNKPEKSLQLAKELIRKYPRSARALLNLATEYQAMEETGKFRDLAYEAILADPESPLGYRSLAVSWLINEPADFTLAHKYIKKFIELRPNEASAYIVLGDIHRANLALEEAKNAYAHAKKLDPESVIAASKLGNVHIYMGKFKEARNEFAEAIEYANRTPEEYKADSYVAFYLIPGNGKIATSGRLPAMNVNMKKNSRYYLNGQTDHCYFCCSFIAMTYGFFVYQGDQPMNACQYLQNELEHEAKVIDAETLEANISFIKAFRSIQNMDYEQAKLDALKYAYTLEPGIPPVRNEAYNFLVGLIHLGSKNYYKALYSFKNSDTDNLFVKYNLALIYNQLGQFDNAEKLFSDVASCKFGNSSDVMIVKHSNKWLLSYENTDHELK